MNPVMHIICQTESVSVCNLQKVGVQRSSSCLWLDIDCPQRLPDKILCCDWRVLAISALNDCWLVSLQIGWHLSQKIWNYWEEEEVYVQKAMKCVFNDSNQLELHSVKQYYKIFLAALLKELRRPLFSNISSTWVTTCSSCMAKTVINFQECDR